MGCNSSLFSLDIVVQDIACLLQNAGWFGEGRFAISLLSIEIIVAVVGLSHASSCTHNKLMCMHLKISSWKHISDKCGSTRDEI